MFSKPDSVLVEVDHKYDLEFGKHVPYERAEECASAGGINGIDPLAG